MLSVCRCVHWIEVANWLRFHVNDASRRELEQFGAMVHTHRCNVVVLGLFLCQQSTDPMMTFSIEIQRFHVNYNALVVVIIFIRKTADDQIDIKIKWMLFYSTSLRHPPRMGSRREIYLLFSIMLYYYYESSSISRPQMLIENGTHNCLLSI